MRSSCWQSEGASSIPPTNWLTSIEKPRRRLRSKEIGRLLRVAQADPTGCGEYADLSSPRSIPARVADDTNGRSDSRSDPLREDCDPARDCHRPRRLSEQLMISRNTVVRAYDLLLMEGIVESRPASGIYVAEQLARQPVPIHAPPELSDRGLADSHAAAAAAGTRAKRACSRPVIVCCLISFRAGPARICFRSRPGAVCCRRTCPTAARRASPNTAIRRGFRRCARRLPIIWRHRAALSPTPRGIVIVSGVQEGLAHRGAIVPGPRRARRCRRSLLSRRGAPRSKLRAPKLQVWPSTATA